VGLLVLLFVLAIIASLAFGLRYMFKPGDGSKMAKALTVRIALSVALFVLLLLAWAFGLIQPHGLGG
jgi:hypothetical protein